MPFAASRPLRVMAIAWRLRVMAIAWRAVAPASATICALIIFFFFPFAALPSVFFEFPERKNMENVCRALRRMTQEGQRLS